MLRLLAKKGRDLGEFAVAVGMVTEEQRAKLVEEHGEERGEYLAQRQALANMRQYTHAKTPKGPSIATVKRWAEGLSVDPVEFYKDVK